MAGVMWGRLAALQMCDFVGQLGKLRADGIGAPAPAMSRNALFQYGHRFPLATVPKHKCYKTLWLHVRARKLSGIGRFRLPSSFSATALIGIDRSTSLDRIDREP